jgi:hypothetical protein
MARTKAADDVLNDTEASSGEDGPQCVRISAKEMARLSKERDEMSNQSEERDEAIGSVSDETSAIVFFH